MAKKYDKEKLLAEWKTGEFSQRQLAKKYDISNGTAAKLTKGVPKENERLIKKIVETKQELAKKDYLETSIINEQVEQKTKNLMFIHNATLKNASVMMKKVDEETTHQEHKFVQETLIKAGETLGVIDKGSAVNINNTNAQQNLQPTKIEII